MQTSTWLHWLWSCTSARCVAVSTTAKLMMDWMVAMHINLCYCSQHITVQGHKKKVFNEVNTNINIALFTHGCLEHVGPTKWWQWKPRKRVKAHFHSSCSPTCNWQFTNVKNNAWNKSKGIQYVYRCSEMSMTLQLTYHNADDFCVKLMLLLT